MKQPTPAVTRRRPVLGLVLAAGFAFTLSLAGSALKSTVQVYFDAMAGDFQVGVGAFAWSTTTFAVVIAVASPLVGALADRFGRGSVLVAGTLLAGFGFLACAAAPGVVVFAPLYGVVGAVSFTMLSFVPLGKLADELFAGRGDGLAYAVMTNGPAVGFVVLVPLWVWLGTLASWRTVFLGAGVVMLVVMAPLALAVRRLTIAVGNRGVVRLAVAFAGCGVTMAFIDVHMVADLSMAGMQPQVVSSSLVLPGVLEILGGLAAGRLCDRGAIKQTLAAAPSTKAPEQTESIVAPAAAAFRSASSTGSSYVRRPVAATATRSAPRSPSRP